MAVFVPDGEPIMMPTGTVRTHDGTTWGLYHNAKSGASWVIWRISGGYQVMPLVSPPAQKFNISQIEAFINAKASTGCCDQGD